MRMQSLKRALSLLLAAALVLGLQAPVFAAGVPGTAPGSVTVQQVDNDEVSASLLQKTTQPEPEAALYAAEEEVRVSIVMEQPSTLDAGFSTRNIAENNAAMEYRADLQDEQDAVVEQIEDTLGQELDVVWHLTLAANLVSANVEYGKIDEIAQVPGVEKVIVEQTYKPLESGSGTEVRPDMAVSAGMTGARQVWESGYHGAGTRIAVIDTGLDTDHQSFDPAALQHAYEVSAAEAGMSVGDYMDSLELLTPEEINTVLHRLNIHQLMPELTADDLYINLKAPFGINYIDRNQQITHDNDSASEHGSHVSGIAAANRFLEKDGEYVEAADSVYTLGNAPDAQILVMKVFGENSPTDADYMAALEDAILLGADVVNLSLGASNPGGTISRDYQPLMESLVSSDTVVAIAAGNEGPWSAHASGYRPNLYVEDVGMQTTSEPSTFTNSLSVASVDNNGMVSTSLVADGHHYAYLDGKSDWCDALATLDPSGEGTAYDFVFLTGNGLEADYTGIDVQNKIVLVSRGDISFTDKAKNAVARGAAATIVYNNAVDNVQMVLEGYYESEPCAMISKADAEAIRETAVQQTAENGTVYYTGSLTVSGSMSPLPSDRDYYTMSAFSSWGVPGDLSMKPEISAPGGNIYSVDGSKPETDQYELMSGTSMATPQVAGLSALLMEHLEKNNLIYPGLHHRAMAQSILMSTAIPMRDSEGRYISILQQGAGLADIRSAIDAQSFVTVPANVTAGGVNDGKAKFELGDDPDRTGSYTVSFEIHNMSEQNQIYELSADLFTQDTFVDYAGKAAAEAGDDSRLATYMSYSTRPLNADVRFTVGKGAVQPMAVNAGWDFDGDGIVGENDAKVLLDYAVGNIDTMESVSAADLNQDGRINSYDAHLLLLSLNENSVAVHAGSTVTVTAVLTLDPAEKAYLDATYPNGAYLEGFVNAVGLADAEGASGTAHFIPLLGFYGNWTDPSMFELGSTQAKLSGAEIRDTYTGEGEADEGRPAAYNTLEVEYARDPGYAYLLGGNPVDPSEPYNPARTAINNQNGDRIYSVKFSPIRNAAASRIQMTDAENRVIWQRFPGYYPGAYYGIMMFFPMWINSNYRHMINFVPGELQEGEHFAVSVTLAPEYYADYLNERADWDALGHGATLRFDIGIDNTAPEIVGDVQLDLEKKLLTVNAKDNQYIAGVALFDRSGRNVIDSTGSVADARPGDTDSFELSLTKANGKKFLLQVFDYAYNVTTYEISQEMGEPVQLPHLIAHDLEYADYGPGYWTAFDLDSNHTALSTYAKSPVTMDAATIYNHHVFAADTQGNLYVMHEEDLFNQTRIANLGMRVDDMAYSAADDTIYAVADSVLYRVDPMTAAVTRVGALGIRTNTLAVNAAGTFYCNELGTSKIYTFTADTLADPAFVVECLNDQDAAFASTMRQSMEFDPATGNVVWLSFQSTPSSWGTNDVAYLYEITPAGQAVMHDDLRHHLTALVIPAGGHGAPETDFGTVEQITGLNLLEDELLLQKSTGCQLTVDVIPWNAENRMVTWHSDNEEVAAVDSSGRVTAVGAGTAVITVTSRQNPAYSDSVTVEVKDSPLTLHGVVSDLAGKTTLFDWNLQKANTWEPGMELETDVIAATADQSGDYLYVTAGSGATVKKVNVWDGSVENAVKWQRIMNDLAFSTVFSTGEQDLVHMVCSSMWLPAKDLTAEPDGSAYDLMNEMQKLNPEFHEFVGIASGGAIRYTGEDGIPRDAELLYLLDDQGGVLTMYVYADPEAAEAPYYNAGFDYYPSNLKDAGYEVTYDNDNAMSSLVAGNDGSLYFAGFNGTTSELFRLTFREAADSFDAERFAEMGSGVWPAALTNAWMNDPVSHEPVVGAMGLLSRDAEVVDLQPAAEAVSETTVPETTVPETTVPETTVPETTIPETSAPAAAPSSAGRGRPATRGEGDVVITIPAGQPVTNGKLTVEFDASKLTLRDAAAGSMLNACSVRDGKLVFAYASAADIPAGSSLLTLTFVPGYGDQTQVTVTTSERNEQLVDEVETYDVRLKECAHEDTELRGAKDPTETEPGYTGDLYCKICGALLQKGEVIPATGHPTEPAQPDASTQPSVPAAKPGTAPDTGDHSSVMLWSVVGVVALAGAVVLILRHRKHSDK